MPTPLDVEACAAPIESRSTIPTPNSHDICSDGVAARSRDVGSPTPRPRSSRSTGRGAGASTRSTIPAHMRSERSAVIVVDILARQLSHATTCCSTDAAAAEVISPDR